MTCGGRSIVWPDGTVASTHCEGCAEGEKLREALEWIENVGFSTRAGVVAGRMAGIARRALARPREPK